MNEPWTNERLTRRRRKSRWRRWWRREAAGNEISQPGWLTVSNRVISRPMANSLSVNAMSMILFLLGTVYIAVLMDVSRSQWLYSGKIVGLHPKLSLQCSVTELIHYSDFYEHVSMAGFSNHTHLAVLFGLWWLIRFHKKRASGHTRLRSSFLTHS